MALKVGAEVEVEVFSDVRACWGVEVSEFWEGFGNQFEQL